MSTPDEPFAKVREEENIPPKLSILERFKKTLKSFTIVLVICVFCFEQTFVYYGYGISELNSAEYSMAFYTHGEKYNATVKSVFKTGKETRTKTCHNMKSWFKDCIPMNSDNMWVLCSSLFSVGGLIGAFVAGPITKIPFLGRKWTVWISAVFYIISCLMKSLFSNFWLLLFGRIVHGFAAGMGSTTVPMYVDEISPVEIRGFFGTFAQVATTLGIFISQLISNFTGKGQTWRILLGWPIVLGLYQVIFIPFLPRSPKFLADRGKIEAAKKSLRRLRNRYHNEELIEEELDYLTGGRFSSKKAKERKKKEKKGKDEQPFLSTNKTQEEDEENNYNNNNQDVIYPDDDDNDNESSRETKKKEFSMKIFSVRTFYHLILALMIQVIQQVSGINAIMFYSTKVYADIFPQKSIPVILSTVTMFINMISVIPPVFLMDCMGRKFLLLFGTIFEITTMLFVTVGMAVMKYGFNNTGPYNTGFGIFTMINIFLFIFFFEVSLGPIPWFITCELFTTNIMPIAQGIAVAVNWGGAFVVTLIFPYLKEGIGLFSFLVFVVAMIISFLFLFCCLMETKGKTVEEVCKTSFKDTLFFCFEKKKKSKRKRIEEEKIVVIDEM